MIMLFSVNLRWIFQVFAIVAIWLGSNVSLFADGMVVPQKFAPTVEIPDQQAMIAYADGVEHLIIETSFLGQGTNFAWVVPVPAVPEVKPVSENFLNSVRSVFRPRLVHPVRPYFVAVIFVCGILVIAWRAYKDERRVAQDLPLCFALAIVAGAATGTWVTAVLVFGFAFVCRIFARTTIVVTVVTLMAIVFSFSVLLAPSVPYIGLMETAGDDSNGRERSVANDVRIVSVQHAGLFDSTVIQSSQPRALVFWLEKNGYAPSKDAEAAIASYVKDGWYFVVSKLRRDDPGMNFTTMHPLEFSFATDHAVYPMRLTAADNGECAVNLYVFGQGSASARHFSVERSDRVPAVNRPPGERFRIKLGEPDSEAMSIIGNAPVGTLLSGHLSPRQMRSDTAISIDGFHATGAFVYSYSAAFMVALNIAVILGLLAWLALGASRGGWSVTESDIRRWRVGAVVVSIALAISIFFYLPKVEIVPQDEGPRMYY